MATKSSPTLKSCHNNKQCEARHLGADDDLLSVLPRDILLSIVSSFNLKEAAIFSLVSRGCELAWRCSPVLILEDYHAAKKIENDFRAIVKERSGFLSRVDRVLEKHLGTTIDELRITFDLDKDSQSYLDKWVAFALDKHVRRLELDFSSTWRKRRVKLEDGTKTYIDFVSLDLPPKFSGFNSFLTSLCLRYVEVTDEFVDYLSHSCPLLEILCIVGSVCLTRVTCSFINLKHLEVSLCVNLRKIDVSAPKLHSFELYCESTWPQLHIADAPFLSKVMMFAIDGLLVDVFGSLSEYFSQLVHLSLGITLFNEEKLDMQNIFMPKLEHLELLVNPMLYLYPSLEGWISLLAASPILQKLTVKVMFRGYPFERKQPASFNWVRFPLKCLKKLELVGYLGNALDLELVRFVVENARMLEDITVILSDDNTVLRERFEEVGSVLPQSIKLTLK